MKLIFNKSNIYVFQGEAGDVNSTLIEYKDYLLLIDTMYARKDLLSLKNRIKEFNKPVKFIINTHFHFDHFWGNKTLSNPSTIFIGQKNYLKTATSRIKSQKELEKLLSKNRYPDITFNKSINLNELYIFSTPGHTIDSICIYDSINKILIAGDTVLGRQNNLEYPPYFVEGTATQMKKSLEQIMHLSINLIIPGHFEPVKKDKIENDINYLDSLIQQKNISLNFNNELIQKIDNDNKKNLKRGV